MAEEKGNKGAILKAEKIDEAKVERERDVKEALTYLGKVLGGVLTLVGFGTLIYVLLTWIGLSNEHLKIFLSILIMISVFLLFYLIFREIRIGSIIKEKNKVKQHLRDSNNLLKKHEIDIDKKDKKISDTVQIINKLTREVNATKDKNINLTGELKKLQKSLDTEKKKSKDLKVELEKEKQETEQIVKSLDEKDDIIKQFEKKIKGRKRDLRKQKNIVEILEQEKNELEKKITETENELESKRNEAESLTTKIARSESEIIRLNKLIKSARERPILQTRYNLQNPIFSQKSHEIHLKNIGYSEALNVVVNFVFSHSVHVYNGNKANWTTDAMGKNEVQSINFGTDEELSTAAKVKVNVRYEDKYGNSYSTSSVTYKLR